MAATLATLPLDVILCISAFLTNPLDVLSLSQACRSTFLASLDRPSYWSSAVPVAHLPRPAPWHTYSPGELRQAHVRYAASHRGWESPSPTFEPPLRLPLPRGPNCDRDFYLRWRSIRGTRWAWSLQRSTGEISFCDLRTGLDIGKWSAGGWVTDALIESRSPNHWVLCHWKTNRADVTSGSGFEIVVTSVTLEQANFTSPIKLTFSTIQRTPVEKETSLSTSPMVIWRDYLIGPYIRARNKRTCGLLLWGLKENATFYCEMTGFTHGLKVRDDLLFVKLEITGRRETYRCLHMPSLVNAAQLPGGSLDLTEDAFAKLLPDCKMETYTPGSIGSIHEEIYAIPSCLPTHPKYCIVFSRVLEQSRKMDWEVFEVEMDLSIPGPIKIFRRISRQYNVPRPTYFFHEGDDDLLLSLPSESGHIPCAPLSVRFLRVGKLDDWRVATLRGIDKMRVAGLHVDRDAGYIITWVTEGWLWWTRECSFIWWIDETKLGPMVHSPAKDLASGWSLRGFW